MKFLIDQNDQKYFYLTKFLAHKFALLFLDNLKVEFLKKYGYIMPWIWMSLAIVFEVIGTVNLKLSDGMTRLIPSILLFVCYSTSFYSLSRALQELNIAVAYAVWAGLGTILIAMIGFLYFEEPFTMAKILFITLIILGVAGLNLAASAS